MSSRTSCSAGISCSFPSRTTFTGRSATRVNWSTARFARISCTMPMTVLMTATTRKPMFSTEDRAIISSAARITKIRLKKVKQWVRMISLSVLPECFAAPAGVRWAACSEVKPSSAGMLGVSSVCSMEHASCLFCQRLCVWKIWSYHRRGRPFFLSQRSSRLPFSTVILASLCVK